MNFDAFFLFHFQMLFVDWHVFSFHLRCSSSERWILLTKVAITTLHHMAVRRFGGCLYRMMHFFAFVSFSLWTCTLDDARLVLAQTKLFSPSLPGAFCFCIWFWRIFPHSQSWSFLSVLFVSNILPQTLPPCDCLCPFVLSVHLDNAHPITSHPLVLVASSLLELQERTITWGVYGVPPSSCFLFH